MKTPREHNLCSCCNEVEVSGGHETCPDCCDWIEDQYQRSQADIDDCTPE